VKVSPIIYLALLLLGYALPWVMTPTVAGFTNSAYDLAEWVSIMPLARAESLLLTPLLLRIPLVCIAIVIAFSDESRSTLWLRLLGLFILAIALLPPLEYFTIATGDANYQQSFLLSVAVLIVGGIAAVLVEKLNTRIVIILRVVVLLAALFTGGAGLANALPLLRSFGLDAQVGIGALGFTLVCITGIAWTLTRRAQTAGADETG
jgi:hypothetical protein